MQCFTLTIGWVRLAFSAVQDVVDVWQWLAEDPRLIDCDLNLAFPVFDQMPSNGTNGFESEPPREEVQWPSQICGAVEAWNQVPASSDVLIAILDTGCDTDHSEFEGCSRIEYGRDWSKVGFFLPEAYNGHGM